MKSTFRVFCAVSLLAAGCTTPGKRTAVGAGAGAAVGAGLGAVIGHQSGNKGKGAAIGAAAGAVLGGSIGNHLDRQAKELEQVAETKRTEEGIVTTLKNNILFDTNSAALKSEAQSNIDQIGDILKKYPEDKINVVGHTDDRGAAEFNQRLSEQRAQAVRLQLISRGVPESRIAAIGMGESQPASPNTTAAGQAKNRRVELHISMEEAMAR